jgi:hypothetical protein
MKMKNNVNLIWVAIVFLAIGLIAGLLITNLTTTGNATYGISTSYETKSNSQELSIVSYEPVTQDGINYIDIKLSSEICIGSNCNDHIRIKEERVAKVLLGIFGNSYTIDRPSGPTGTYIRDSCQCSKQGPNNTMHVANCTGAACGSATCPESGFSACNTIMKKIS